MSERTPLSDGTRRRNLELALAALAGWLAVQNLLLLATRTWANPAAARVVAAAILKSGAALIAMSWPWLVAVALATAISSVALIERMPRGSREVRHGG